MITKKGIVGLLAVAVIAASLFFLLHKPTEKAEQTATNVSEALGLRAGEEVARLLGQKGRIAVLEMELESGQAPTAVVTVEKFRQTLKKHGVTVARTKAIRGGLGALVMGRGISREDYVGVVEGAPSVDAVVTFAGLPNWPGDELHQFQANHPRLVVVDIFGTLKGPTLAALVEQKTVALAFMPRSATEVEQQGGEQRMFERYYRILGPPAK
jgi:preprotein translocase subunit YajC